MSMFTPSEETQALVDSAERFVREQYLDQTPGFDPGRCAAMAELGWPGTAVREKSGGYGLPLSSLCALIEALAPAAMSEPLMSETALASALLDEAEPGAARDGLLEAWLAGDARPVLAHRESRDGNFFTRDVGLSASNAYGELVLNGVKRAVIDGGSATHALVSVADNSGRIGLVIVPVDADGLTWTSVPGIDGRSFADPDFNDVSVPSANQLEFNIDVADAIEAAQDRYALLCAADSLGLVRTLLDVTHKYLLQREQFGQKLADFQVLQHRMVDMHLSVERLASLVTLARMAADKDGIVAARGAIAAAREQAAITGRHVGTEAVQLHGGMGMTDELVVGRYLKRLTVNELIAGNERESAARRDAFTLLSQSA